MIEVLRSKTARTALWFLFGCALLLCVRHRLRLGLINEQRFAVLRELALEQGSPELLFLGTSRTARGIQPKTVESRLAELGEPGVDALNLAIVGTARPVAYLLLKDWLRDHEPPRVVFCEHSLADITEWPHQRAADFLGPFEALRVLAARPYTWASQKSFGSQLKHPSRYDPGGVFRAIDRQRLNLELGIAALGAGPTSCAKALWSAIRNRMAGRGYWLYWRAAEVQGVPEILPEQVAREVAERGWYQELTEAGLASLDRAAAADDPAMVVAPFDLPERFRGTKFYTELLIELCASHGIRLVFVQLPGFRETTSPAHHAYHRERAEVFEPDPAAFRNPDLFADTGHLRPAGAEWLSKELAEWLFTNPR